MAPPNSSPPLSTKAARLPCEGSAKRPHGGTSFSVPPSPQQRHVLSGNPHGPWDAPALPCPVTATGLVGQTAGGRAGHQGTGGTWRGRLCRWVPVGTVTGRDGHRMEIHTENPEKPHLLKHFKSKILF